VKSFAPKAILLIIAISCVAGFLFGRLDATKVAAAAPRATEPPPPPGSFRPSDGQWAALTLAPVIRTLFQTERETDGRIAANDDSTTPVFSPLSGRVSRIQAHAGDRVQAGDPLAVVEASEFVQAQNDLVAARAAKITADAQAALAETAERRQHDLFDAKGGALKDWQQAQVDLAAARGQARTADIALAAARNRLRILGKTDAEIARLDRAPEARMGAESTVRAPIGGTVIQRQVGLGQYIQSGASGGASPIFSIGDLSTVWLVANVREADAPLMRVGLPVEVRIEALPGRVFHARLAYVAPSIDPATRRLPVRAEVDNPDGLLKPEMFARFRILGGNETLAPAVPDRAVVREGDEARVWVADPTTRLLALRRIRTGRTTDDLVEVSEGLAPGETVVSGGALFIDRAATGE